MTDAFASPKRRLARAKEQISDLKARIEAWSKGDPYARVIESNARGLDEHKVRVATALPGVITDIAYEAIEALRSSLDQATYAVAIACNVRRPDLIHFPVADTEADFENVLKGRLQDFPPDILTFFRAINPYQAGNEIIWALNRIRRQSSHRLLVPVGNALHGVAVKNLTISSPAPCEIPPPLWDSEKNEITLVIVGHGSNLQYDIDLAFFVAFGQVEGLAGEPIAETLEAMASEVERIVLAIEAESRRIGLIAVP
jgi:hypothetical protein